MGSMADFGKMKDYPLHGRTRTLHEVEHENETLRRMNSKLQGELMIRNVIITDLQNEVDALKKELAHANKGIEKKQKGRGSTEAASATNEAKDGSEVAANAEG